MEIFDVLVWFLGRWVHRVFIYLGLAKREMSDGGYWALGFLAVCFVDFFFFIVWSVLHGYQEVDVVDLELTHEYT
jgi:hypothetical protein